jgi:hypothetical protein
MLPQTYIICNVIFIFISFAKDTIVATEGDSREQQQQQTPFLINLLLLLLLLGKNVSCCFFFLCLQLVDSVVTRDG